MKVAVAVPEAGSGTWASSIVISGRRQSSTRLTLSEMPFCRWQPMRREKNSRVLSLMNAARGAASRARSTSSCPSASYRSGPNGIAWAASMRALKPSSLKYEKFTLFAGLIVVPSIREMKSNGS